MLERLEEDEEEKGVNTSMQLSSSVSSILEVCVREMNIRNRITIISSASGA